MKQFEIDIKALCWINESKDDPDDLCLHGDVSVKIGNELFTYYATVSSTALYLLKSLTENHIIGQENQMLPCCGFTMLANEDLTNVDIIGCC